MNQEQANKRIKELKGYYSHLGVFVSVNLFLIMVNAMSYSEDQEIWFVYPLFGWGIGLVAHTIKTFGVGGRWEERKMQELTGWSMTQEELERLSQRTENLITILSSVKWEKIDPELLESRDNLLAAGKKLVELRDGKDSGDGRGGKAEVVREIEKLEEFVTSSKFSYYDQASNDSRKG